MYRTMYAFVILMVSMAENAKKPQKNTPGITVVESARRGRFSRVERIVVVLVLAVLIVGGGVWYWQAHRKKPAPPQIDGDNQYLSDMQHLRNQKPPSDPVSRAFFYNQLAYDYQQLKDYDQALANYQKAQAVVDKDNLKLQTGVVSYRSIGDVYLAKGDKAQAKNYYEHYISFMQEYKKQNPDPSIDTIINEVQKQVDKL